MAIYPVSSGVADLSGTYIPQLWDPRIQMRFYANSVIYDICNTDIEGTIKKYGDKVYIRTLPDITVSTYNKGQKLNVESPSAANKTLSIDSGKYFAFLLEDVDEVQSDLDRLSAWTETAGKQLQEQIDTAVLQGIYASGHASNMGTTAGVDSAGFNLGAYSGSGLPITKSNIIDYIADCASVLDEQNCPDDGKRWIVLPPLFTNLISKSDLKDASLSGDGESIARNGKLGIIANMTVYKSNHVKSVSDTNTCWYCPFGHPMAISFASQLDKTETITSQDTFGKIVRGLMVYGYSVTKTEALGILYGYKG